MIQVKDLDVEKIKNAIDSLGDSLILAGNKNKIRIHIHTNDPEELFFKLKNYGRITFQKVDDMKRQYESIYDRKSEIAIITDSIADIPKELMDESNQYPSSSQVTLKEAERLLKEVANNYNKILVITVSSKMSGTYEVLNKASKSLEDGVQIEVIDSKLNSRGEGFLVLKAVEEIEKSKSFDQVVETVKQSIKKTNIFVSVPTLKYMLKSGRIGKVQALAANMVNLKPVVSIDENGDGIIIGKEPEYIMEISTVVAMNAGIGSVAIALITE